MNIRMRRLTAELLRLRKSQGLTVRDVGRLLGISQSTVSRIETIGLGLHRDALVELLTLYKVPRHEKAGLLQMLEQLNEPGLLDRDQLKTNEDTENWTGLEQDATRIFNYETLLIPGLLQTFPYAKALFECYGLPEEEVTGRTNARIARQVVLRRRAPLAFEVVMHEAALREVVGGPAVMLGQLDHLIEIGRHPGVTIRVLPFGRGAHQGLTSPFAIMEYRVMPSIVLLENQVADLYLEEKADINAYKLSWQAIRALTFGPEDSAVFIADIAGTLRMA